MIANFFISFLLFSSSISLTFIKNSRVYNRTKTEVSQDLRDAKNRRANKTFETTRKVPHDSPVPQKHMCPPIDTPVIHDDFTKECDEIRDYASLSPHPDQFKLTPEILVKYGYGYEEHRVRTEDGYILTVYRITWSPNLKTNYIHKTPVYVNHGLCTASDHWLFLNPEKCLVFMLADEGYDVWLGNARGSSYSLEHDYLDHNKDLSYWEFSFHEMAIYDVPAVTNRILQGSDHLSILYIGFSMGTTQIIISLSEIPEMNQKIRAAFLLAPVIHMGHSPSVLRNVAAAGDTEEIFRPVNRIFKGKIRSKQDWRRLLALSGTEVCASSAAKCGLCDDILFAVNGVNPPQLNRSTIQYFLEKMPDSTSYKTLVHFGQFMTSCRFQKFEYTPAINLKKYGSLRPPLYNLKNVSSPLYLYHGEQDVFGIPQDVHDFVRHLNDGVAKKVVLVPDYLFTHMDFQIAKDADKLVYNEVLNDMSNYIEFVHKRHPYHFYQY